MHLSHKEFLRIWKLKPVVATDCVVIKNNNQILLIKRATPPFKGMWCLPGGMMLTDETIEQTALRELREETGVAGKIIRLIGVYSGPHRDPRGTSLSAVFLMKFVKMSGKHDKEVSEAMFFDLDDIPKRMGFDHKEIIKDALKLLRKKKKDDML